MTMVKRNENWTDTPEWASNQRDAMLYSLSPSLSCREREKKEEDGRKKIYKLVFKQSNSFSFDT